MTVKLIKPGHRSSTLPWLCVPVLKKISMISFLNLISSVHLLETLSFILARSDEINYLRSQNTTTEEQQSRNVDMMQDGVKEKLGAEITRSVTGYPAAFIAGV